MFFVAKICKRALRASIEGYLAVAASTPTYSSLGLAVFDQDLMNLPAALVHMLPVPRHTGIEEEDELQADVVR